MSITLLPARLVESVAALIEKMEKPGLMGAVGQRCERACVRDVASYFRLLATRVPVRTLALLATVDNKELARHSVQVKMANVLRGSRPMLVELLKTNYEAAYLAGWRVAQVHPHTGLKEADGDDAITPTGTAIDQLGPSGQRAADFASTTAAETVVGIDDTTLDTLQDIISDGIDERIGVDGLARRIRSEINGMTTGRARVIATTEMNRAFSTAALEKMDAIGIQYKRWIPVDDPCDICEENEADGAIEVDEMFSSGDDAPPGHPNCRCAVVGARAPE